MGESSFSCSARAQVCLALALAALAAGTGTAAAASKRKPPPKPQAKIVRGPYLQQTAKTSTFVVWQTDRPAAGRVHYGQLRTSEHVRADPTKTTFHAVQITGLRSNTSYAYRVRVGKLRTPAVWFTTAKRGPLPFNFAVIGDYGTGSTAEYQNAALMATEPIDLGITTGDNVYGNGFNSEYDRGLFAPFGSLMGRVPFWPSLGNHDYGNDESVTRNDASGYLQNFVLPDQPAAERYYSFKQANVQFLSIDSEIPYGPDSAQYAWIEQTLAASGACWKIPYFHQPPYSSRSSTTKLRTTLVPLFERYGVKLALSGHQHNYERTVPLLGGVEDDAAGVTYVVTGGGGATLHSFSSSPPPARTVTRGVFFHHLLVSVNGNAMTVSAIDTAGALRDQFSLSCGP